MTDLTSKAIDIRGKSYIQVKDRILFFNENYPNGAIRTELVKYENGQVIVKAIVTPDVEKSARSFEDFSQASESNGMINKTSALENASTSATGRALALMGIGIIDAVASADEMAKAGAGATDGQGKSSEAPVRVQEEVTIKDYSMDEEEEAPHVCSAHGDGDPIPMSPGRSKSTGKENWYHRNAAGQICFASGYKE